MVRGRRSKAKASAVIVALLVLAPAASAQRRCTLGPRSHDHADARHATACGLDAVARLEVSEDAGLGRIEMVGKLAAVLERDQGAVALVDLRSGSPRLLGRYDDGARRSLDGDLAASHDARFVFYARQTEQFSRDGLHVLDVSDPSDPKLAWYEPQGGTLRVAYHRTGESEWVISLDATHGLVIHRFERPAGALVAVHVDALPPLKVGGPASAGLFVQQHDPILGIPLLYVSTGRTGLQVFDLSDPSRPVLLGGWNERGLAELEVVASDSRRTVYAANEYWFDRAARPQVVVLDATRLDAIEQTRTLRAPVPADSAQAWQVQGMALGRGELYVAHSHAGVVGYDLRTGALNAVFDQLGDRNDAARPPIAPYAFDIEVHKGALYATDASTGVLQVLRRL